MLGRTLLRPLHDFTAAVRRVMPDLGWRTGLAALGATLAAWWIYVPAHELLHAFGCLAGGGSVERLEISSIYGAALLQRVFPFVAVGSEYAGQLVGFDTRGSDWTYFLTVFAPYVLTIFAGVPVLLQLVRRGRPGLGSSLLFGACLPAAYASFANITGDFYEMGSIPVSRAAVALGAGSDPARWRSDDMMRLAGRLAEDGAPRLLDLVVMAVAFSVGAALAFATYQLGVWFHAGLSRRGTRERA
jgi:hypothetical protein